MDILNAVRATAGRGISLAARRAGKTMWALSAMLLAVSVVAAQEERAPSAETPAPAAAAPAPIQAADDDDVVDSSEDAAASAANYAARAAAAQARLDALPKDAADAALRDRVAEQWKEALTQWQSAGQAVELLARRRQTVEGAAARLQVIQDEKNAILARTAAAEAPAAGEQTIAELEAELRELDHNLPEWTKQLGQRVTRLETQADRLAESRQAAADAQAVLAEKGAPVPDALPAELKAAMREAQTARQRAAREIIAGSDYFRNIQEPLAQLDAAERDLLTRRIEFGKARRERLADRIAALRRDAAETLRRESEAMTAQIIAELPSAFRKLAEDNRAYADILDKYLRHEKDGARYLQDRNHYIQSMQSDYERIRNQLESGGGGRELGAYLWGKRRSLRREAYLAGRGGNAVASANADLPGLSFSALDEMRRRIPGLEQDLLAFSNRPDIAALPEARRAELVEQAGKMLDNYAALVGNLSESVSRQSALLIDVDETNKELIRVSNRYAELVDSHILHLPGTPPLWRIPVAAAARRAWNSLGNAYVWRAAGGGLVAGLTGSFPLLLLMALAVAPAVVRRVLNRKMNLVARTPVAATPKGLLWRAGRAFFRAYPAPLALFAAGAALWNASVPGGNGAALGEAALLAAEPWFLLKLWRRFCDPDGIFETYAGMPRILTDRLRRRLASVIRYGLPLWMLVLFAQSRTEPAAFQEIGGVMSALLAALAVGFWLLRMRPAAFLRDSAPRRPLFWRALHLLMVALGLFWFGMSLLGYNYGALLIIAKATSSGLLVTALALAALFWRLRLARSRDIQRARAIVRYRLGEARRRREERSNAEKADVTGGDVRRVENGEGAGAPGKERAAPSSRQAADASSGGMPPELEKELDATLADAARLVRWLFVAALAAALLVQWSDIFPVQNWLDTLTLFARDNAGGLTLRHALWAFAGGGLCCLIANPLGSWVNLSFFGWNPAERGTRMATAALIRYATIGVGIVWTAQELGMAWSDAQWLVAALSVGLGFGLQEIILNFVCGIILLFERPVRVGDVVTIGSADGTIQRINIRTTTVVDFNRREIIIPNKELVTGRVVNWTLSDAVTRLVVSVRVAYGSDLELVQKLLLEAANSVDAVLDDPAPSVFFQEMADSSLDFELRLYTGTLADRTPAQHQVRLNINRLFLENGIEIPFPQLDVHMR